LGCRDLDSGIDIYAIRDHPGNDVARQLAGPGVGLDLGEVALQDGHGSALSEVRLEHRREGDASARPERADPIGHAQPLAPRL
jgi:hypothetical protein